MSSSGRYFQGKHLAGPGYVRLYVGLSLPGAGLRCIKLQAVEEAGKHCGKVRVAGVCNKVQGHLGQRGAVAVEWMPPEDCQKCIVQRVGVSNKASGPDTSGRVVQRIRIRRMTRRIPTHCTTPALSQCVVTTPAHPDMWYDPNASGYSVSRRVVRPRNVPAP